MFDKISLDAFLGGVFILFYAGNRFNTPQTNRSSTTAGRYFMALFLYCLVGIGCYTLLLAFPHLLTIVVQQSGDSHIADKLTSPLLVALSLTVLLPKVPILSDMDKWVRSHLQAMAAIPYEVRRLSAELRKDKLEITSEEQITMRQQLEDAGFDPKDIRFEPSRAPANLWTRLSALLHRLEDWESDRRMSGYLAACQGELDNLRRRLESLEPKAKTCFRLLAENEEWSATGKTHEAVLRYREDFSDQVRQLHQDTFDFIARGVLHTELTDNARLNRLKTLGFCIEWEPAVFTLNQMMTLFGAVCVVMLSGFVVFADTHSQPFRAVLLRTIMISVIYCVAVACAVFPKARWKFAKVHDNDARPITFYVVAALIAVCITQSLGLLFSCAMTGSLSCGWERFQHTYPWLLMTFGTTLVTGVMVDNPVFTFTSKRGQRFIEGLMQGAVMVGVAYLTYLWLAGEGTSVACDPRYRVPRVQVMMSMSATIGFVIGFFIPTWYRERPHSRVKARCTHTLPFPASAESAAL